MKTKFTVVLLYPDPTEAETYVDHVEAEDAFEAGNLAMQNASKANEGDYAPEDFLPISIFPGHLQDEIGIWKAQ
jgi:hypothetical protein